LDNQKKYSEFIKQNEDAVEKSINFYNNQIKEKIDENGFIGEEIFLELENSTKAHASRKFFENYSGKKCYTQKFENSLNEKLKNKRLELENYNQNQMRKLISSTENELEIVLSYYTENMTKTLNSFRGNEDLHSINENYKAETLTMFERSRHLKNPKLWSQYTNKLDLGIKKVFCNLSKSFEKKLNDLETFYIQTTDNAMKKYFLVIV
jgi:hypothetical protein